MALGGSASTMLRWLRPSALFWLPTAMAFGIIETRALATPQTQKLKMLHFNMAGGAKNKGTYPIIGRIIREVQERKPDVTSLNEICDRQYARLLIQLEAIDYTVRNSGTAQCLAVAGTANNAAVNQKACSTSSMQQRGVYP